MNTCKFCGVQLNGTEAVCPNCGNPVTNINANTSQPAMPGMVEQPVAPVQPNMMNNMNQIGNTANPGVIQQQAPVENMVNSQPMSNPTPINANAPAQQVADSNTTKKKNTTIILVIVLIVVIAIASLVFGVVLLNKESDGKKETKKEEKPSTTEVSTNTTQNVDFAGYTFKIPGDYTYKIDSAFLMIMDNSKTSAYIICFDYTHTYEEYKNYIAATYPTIYADTIVNVNNREYMVVNYQNKAENRWVGTFYTKVPNGTAVYTGTVEHADGSAISINDMQFIEELITNATSVNTFAAGNEYDLGTKGAVDFILNPYKIDFNSNLTNDGTDTNTTPEDGNTTTSNNDDNPEESNPTENTTNSEEG